jgi:hypothetical protein
LLRSTALLLVFQSEGLSADNAKPYHELPARHRACGQDDRMSRQTLCRCRYSMLLCKSAPKLVGRQTFPESADAIRLEREITFGGNHHE